MKIRMLESRPGADDGYTVREYAKGETYEVGPDLGGSFIGAGVAEAVAEPEPGKRSPGPRRSGRRKAKPAA